MRLRLGLCGLASVLSACGSASAVVVIAGPVVNGSNGHSYYLLSEGTWDDAEQAAITLNGHLTTIDNADENAFVLSTFGATAAAAANGGEPVSIWIGLSDFLDEGSFVWADGSPLGYTNFAPGEPAGGFQDEDYVGMLVTRTAWEPGIWHDVVMDGRLNDRCFGVVEVTTDCNTAITNQPQSVALLPNSTAIFEVTVSGTVTGYQWRKNNSNLSDDGRIEGTQSPILTIAGVQSDDQGLYDCVVSDACGTITSDAAELSCEPIVVHHPPASVVLQAGLRLSVDVPNGAPYTYRWRQNGQNLFNIAGLIGGATTRTLTLLAVDPSLAGTYDCALTDVCGETVSDPTQAYCPADFDQDGFISGVDFDDYVSAFENGDIRADFDRDGFLTGIDYDDFVRAFEGGC